MGVTEQGQDEEQHPWGLQDADLGSSLTRAGRQWCGDGLCVGLRLRVGGTALSPPAMWLPLSRPQFVPAGVGPREKSVQGFCSTMHMVASEPRSSEALSPGWGRLFIFTFDTANR